MDLCLLDPTFFFFWEKGGGRGWRPAFFETDMILCIIKLIWSPNWISEQYCPNGYIEGPDFTCFYLALASEAANWQEARRSCERTPMGDLAVVETQEELSFIQSQPGFNGVPFWIGESLFLLEFNLAVHGVGNVAFLLFSMVLCVSLTLSSTSFQISFTPYNHPIDPNIMTQPKHIAILSDYWPRWDYCFTGLVDGSNLS